MSILKLTQIIGNFPYLTQVKYVSHRRIDDPREPILGKLSAVRLHGQEVYLTGKEYITLISHGI